MSRYVRFFLMMLLWILLSALPMRISDYDFKEAVHWSQQAQTVRQYYAVSAIEAVVFAILLAILPDLHRGKWLRVLGAGFLLCGVIVFAYYWITLPRIEWLAYKTFIVSIYVSKMLRIFLSAFLWILGTFTVGNILFARNVRRYE